MTVAEKIAAAWKRAAPKPHTQPAVITIDGDPLWDRRPTKDEARRVLSSEALYEVRKAALYTCTARAYDDGLREGKGYAASPDLVTRRLLEGLQHVVSHVHHHCKHGRDGLEGFDAQDEDEDAPPTTRSLPIAAGSRLSRTAWRRCRQDPCSGLVQIVSDCRLWDALNHPVPHGI